MTLFNARGAHLGLLLGISGAVAFILQGYDQALMNGLLTLPSFLKIFPEMNTTTTSGKTKDQNSTIQGTVVAIYEAGAAFGALSCYFIGDRLGRRRTIQLGAAIVLVGTLLQSTSFSLAQLIVGRIVTGLGVGAITATIPMWISECTKAHRRGRLVMMEGWFAIGGIVFVSWFEFGLYFIRESEVQWRLPVAFQAVLGIPVLILVQLLPESPRWLVTKDRHPAARTILADLEDEDEDSELIVTELSMIQQSIADELVGDSRNPFARTPNRHLHRTILAVFVNVIAQLSGINIITFYSNTVFENTLHYSGTTSRIISGCLHTWQFLAAGIACLLIDRFGRRGLLLAASAGMCISQAGLAGLFAHLDGPATAGATLLFDFISLFTFPLGLLIIPYMYAAEISPLRIRARVSAIAAAANWMSNFLQAEVTPIGFASIGWKYYVVYMCINGASFIIFYLFYPDVKGRSLEEVDEIFLRSQSIWDPVRIAKEMPLGTEPADVADGGDKPTRVELEGARTNAERV